MRETSDQSGKWAPSADRAATSPPLGNFLPSRARRALVWAAWTWLFAPGCTATQSGSQSALTAVEVHIKRGDSREALGHAADEARIAGAAARLRQKLGHALNVEVDAALTPNSRSRLVQETANSMEALAGYFDEVGPDNRALHAFFRGKLMAVAVRYRASAAWLDASFEDATGTLVLSMRETSWRGWFPGDAESEVVVDAVLRAAFAKPKRTLCA